MPLWKPNIYVPNDDRFQKFIFVGFCEEQENESVQAGANQIEGCLFLFLKPLSEVQFMVWKVTQIQFLKGNPA